MTRKNVLANKDFTLLFVGALCSNIGQVFYTFAVGLYVLELSNALIHGLYLAISGIVFLLATPIGGFIADRLNRVRIIYITDYMRGAIIIVSGYIFSLTDNGTIQLYVLFATTVCLNILSGLFNPAAASLIRFIVEDEQLQQAQSYYGLLSSVQNIIGVLLAGILFSFIKISLLFILVGILYILSGFSEMFIRYHQRESSGGMTIGTLFKDYGEGFRYLRGQKALLYMVLGVLFINFFFSPVFSNGTPYFVTYYLTGDYLFSSFVSPPTWKAIFSCAFSIGSLIISFTFGLTKDRGKYGKRVQRWLVYLAISLLLVPASFYAFVVLTDLLNWYLITLTATMFFIGIAVPCINIPLGVAINMMIEKDKLAKVQSLITIGSMGLTPVASFIGGFVIKEFGLGPMFIVCAVGVMVTAVLIGASKEIRNLGVKDKAKTIDIENLIEEEVAL